MSDPVRQRYSLATGKGLTSPPPSKPSPGYAKGGKVMPAAMKGKSGSKRGC